MDPNATEGGAGAGSEDYVFVSYARPDEKSAQAIIDLLDRAGYRVWWDGLIPGGERFGTLISKALEGARAVVVLWSKHAIDSPWVQDEASWARDQHRLIPLSIDGCEPPLGFRQFQCIDISKGGVKAGSPAMQRALQAIADAMGREPVPMVQRTASPRVSRRSALIAGGAAVAAIGGFAAWRLFLRGGSTANSIAVLPFQNLSGDARQQYLSDGLAAELRARLSRNSLLSVVGQASSNAVRNGSDSSQTIARKLRVANVLDGNVRAAGGQVRIAVELIDGKSGFSKWTRTFDGPMANLLQVQTEVADAVSAALAITLGTPEKEPKARSGGTSDVAAFDSYLRGKELFDSQHDEASDRGALAEFTAAVGRDPSYAAARAARSRALAVIANQYAQASERRSLYKEAVDEARRAIASADQYPDGHAALGYALFYGMLDVGAADAPYQKAMDLGAGSSDVLGLCALYRARRRQFDRAFPAIERAQALDPLNANSAKTEGRIRFASGDYRGAIGAAQRALGINPKIGGAHGDMGNALLMLDRLDEATAEFELEKVALLATPGRAIAALRRGDKAAAQGQFDKLRQEEGDNGLYQQAQVLAQWGRNGEALDALDKALSTSDSGMVYLLSDPFLQPLHGEARFKSLLRRIHFV